MSKHIQKYPKINFIEESSEEFDNKSDYNSNLESSDNNNDGDYYSTHPQKITQQQSQKEQKTVKKVRRQSQKPKTEPYERRKYVLQACDQCRKSRIRCENGNPGTQNIPYTPCKKCISDAKDCTFKRVPQKRGRPCGKKNKKKEVK